MMVTMLLIVGSVLLVVSGFSWVARRETVERARSIEALTPAALDELEEGRLGAVRAPAAEDPLHSDPATGERVAFFEARVARTDGGDRTLAHASSGPILVLDDGRGRAEVEVASAEIGLPWRELDESEREPSQRMSAVLASAGAPIPEADRGARYVLWHRAVAAGAPLTVVGTPTPSEERTTTREGYRGGAGALLRFSARRGLLLITPDQLAVLSAREGADVRAMGRMLGIGAGVGAVLVTLGAVLLALA